MSVVDGEGREIYRNTERSLTGGRFDSPDIEVLRDDLCKVLYEAVGDDVEFLFGDYVTSIAQGEAGANVEFAHAATRRFDLVVGADGLYSGIRRIAFGPDPQFLRFMGQHIAVFSIPNFLGLDHWEVLCQDSAAPGLMLATDKNSDARTYLGFETTEPLDYDHRDIAAQKRLIAERYAGAGWEYPRILSYMQEASDFYFYSANQVRMEGWSRGRVVLVGDAGYSVTPATGQGTSVAMVGAYVLAGELSLHKSTLEVGVSSYEDELRDYVARNLDAAVDMPDLGKSEESGNTEEPINIPDFGVLVQPIDLKNYEAPIQ
ncbi:Conserved hypothetical protein [Xanthomonas translucens pv. translucens DSM 18974]|uniref:FAD-binding domain-containing protein n=2 Tax=Xanthomonas campestris pv. translucens TaxID=343 RepID=A0A1C3TNQ7_XANCT|nr:hypothetical protein BN444_00283 [Xanthomonas translucens pv. translucens DSM 18974]SCB04787.1 Conserved hypothetical protein [Xanthomonas translucens pv. translucens DSM 18974]